LPNGQSTGHTRGLAVSVLANNEVQNMREQVHQTEPIGVIFRDPARSLRMNEAALCHIDAVDGRRRNAKPF
jgi:hypothetical protein